MAVKTVTNKNEEREFIRKDILDSFQIFITIPYFGSQKISIIDMSMKGLSFRIEPGMKINEGAKLDCYLYLNTSIRIPLQLSIVHKIDDCGISRAGCEIADTETSAYRAYAGFIGLMHALEKIKDR